MKFGCSSQSYDKALTSGKLDLEKWIELAAKELRLEGIEIEHKHLAGTDRKYIEDVGKLAAGSGLVISNIALYNDFGKASKADNDREFALFEKYLSASRALGLPMMRVFAGWPSSDEPQLWGEMIRYLKQACELAEEAGILLVMENHNHGGFVHLAEHATRVFEEVGSESLKLLLDTGNFIDGIVSIEKTIHLARHVHAKVMEPDAQGNEKMIDYPAIFALCKKADYQGFVSLEYEGEEEEFTAVPRALNRLREIYREVYGM